MVRRRVMPAAGVTRAHGGRFSALPKASFARFALCKTNGKIIAWPTLRRAPLCFLFPVSKKDLASCLSPPAQSIPPVNCMISRIKKLFGHSSPDDATGASKRADKRDLIMFVDDEPEVRSIARITLEEHGYRMIEAEDGANALDIFNKRKQEISLVITDVLMPNLDGLGLAARLHKIVPELPVLLLSGHVLEEDLWAPGNARLRYLMKPYRLTDLVDAVAELVGPAEKPPGAGANPPPAS